jgi:proline iminopeptidase
MKKIFAVILALSFLSSCNNKSESCCKQNQLKDFFSYNEEGFKSGGVKMIPIETKYGTYKVWTKHYGNNPKLKLLVLHGGPALTHEYLECYQSLFQPAGIEFYEYDQLGSYYSDQPNNDSLWTLERFTDEVEQVRKQLGLNKDNFILLGQSWGGIVAMEYALKYQQNLKGLIISNMMSSFPEYGAYNQKLRAELRPSLIDTFKLYENKGDFANPIYQDLVFKEFYTKHICRMPVGEWPEPVMRSFKHINSHVYTLLQGPSEFVPGGLLEKWDVTERLKEIKIPTLMIGAKYDSMDPEFMEKMSKQVQKGSYLYCDKGSHLCMWDDQETYFNGVLNFVETLE